MKVIFFVLFFAAGSIATGQKLPQGVKMDTVPCSYATGQFSHHFFKNNEVIGLIEPSSCHYSETQGGRVNPLVYADFYMLSRKDTFSTKSEALTWIIELMEDYYKPAVITKWQKLMVQPPKVRLKYPWDWTYKLGKFDGIFKSKSLSENKLTLMTKDDRGQSEILQIIRTPNTAKLTTVQVMEITAMMNRAVNYRNPAAVGIVIGGKTFNTSENTFLEHMQQRHFWYADDQEIIYINSNLLKDEKTKYPGVINDILGSITWD